jgi:hypothetical protein
VNYVDQDAINDGHAEEIPAGVIEVEHLPACCRRAAHEARNATRLGSFECSSCGALWEWINPAWVRCAS